MNMRQIAAENSVSSHSNSSIRGKTGIEHASEQNIHIYHSNSSISESQQKKETHTHTQADLSSSADVHRAPIPIVISFDLKKRLTQKTTN